MLVLVAGGTGLIGPNLVDALLHRAYAVRVVDSFSSGGRGNLAGIEHGIELVEGDVRSCARVHHAVRGCEVVFHQGALPSVFRSIQDPRIPGAWPRSTAPTADAPRADHAVA